MSSEETAPAGERATASQKGPAQDSQKPKIRNISMAVVAVFVSAIVLYYMYMGFVYNAYTLKIIIDVVSGKKGAACTFIFPFSGIIFIVGFVVCLIWALYLYVGLRQEADSERLIIEKENQGSKRPVWEVVQERSKTNSNLTGSVTLETNKDDPLSFHKLAQTHKEWSQLWFTVSITIFLGGVIFAIFNLGVFLCFDNSSGDNIDNLSREGGLHWSRVILKLAPNVFVYALFLIAWRWSARHFRAHWHNFISNAYRHRALWRYEEIQRKLIELAADIGFDDTKSTSAEPYMRDVSSKIREQAAATILELHRQSGVLLLLPGDSSYLESGQDEHTAEQIVRIEEIIRSTLSRGP